VKQERSKYFNSTINTGLIVSIITAVITSVVSATFNYYFWKKQFDLGENSKSIELQSTLLDSISSQSFDILGSLESRTLRRLKILRLANPKLDSIETYTISEGDRFDQAFLKSNPEMRNIEEFAQERIKNLFITSFRLLYILKNEKIKDQIFVTLNAFESRSIDSTIANFIIKKYKLTHKNLNAMKIEWDEIDPKEVIKHLSEKQLAETMNLISKFTSEIYNVTIVVPTTGNMTRK
jgi:hypothetical protein